MCNPCVVGSGLILILILLLLLLLLRTSSMALFSTSSSSASKPGSSSSLTSVDTKNPRPKPKSWNMFKHVEKIWKAFGFFQEQLSPVLQRGTCSSSSRRTLRLRVTGWVTLPQCVRRNSLFAGHAGCTRWIKLESSWINSELSESNSSHDLSLLPSLRASLSQILHLLSHFFPKRIAILVLFLSWAATWFICERARTTA